MPGRNCGITDTKGVLLTVINANIGTVRYLITKQSDDIAPQEKRWYLRGKLPVGILPLHHYPVDQQGDIYFP